MWVSFVRALASGDNDAASIVVTDIDIYSYCQVDAFDHINEGWSGNDDFVRYTEALGTFYALDSTIAAVRHASFAESRYCYVFIPETTSRPWCNPPDLR